MKLYDYKEAPNPRRVRVFLAEKGIAVDLVPVDILKGEHKSPEFKAKNARAQIPVLELDDGTCIAESVAICRYLEELHPAPSLFGDTAKTKALIEMHNRRIELGLFAPIGTSWVNGSVVARVLTDRAQIPEAKAQSDAAVNRYYASLDAELATRDYIAGEHYSLADITAMCAIDFAERLVDLPPSPSLSHLAHWRERVAARPSASA